MSRILIAAIGVLAAGAVMSSAGWCSGGRKKREIARRKKQESQLDRIAEASFPSSDPPPYSGAHA